MTKDDIDEVSESIGPTNVSVCKVDDILELDGLILTKYMDI